MDVVSLVIFLAFIGSMYLSGRIAERRGRRSINWVGIASVIGPLALPLLFLFPNLHRQNGDHA